MYEIKAFAHIGALINNTRKEVATVGELSPAAVTYTREKEYFSAASVPGQVLVVFSNKRDGAIEETSPVLAEEVLLVSKWAYNESASGGFTGNPESFRTRFLLEYQNRYAIWSVGVMVKASDNSYMPGFIEFRELADDNIRYKLWFATDVFEQQFDEFQIVCTKPIDDLDLFMQGAATTQKALNDRTRDVTTTMVQAAKEGYPETYISDDMFEWNDPAGIDARKPVYWPLLTYGIAGNNIDAKKEALREFILANSVFTKDKWAEVFPEIFTATEFLVVPLWGFPSVPNKVLSTGLYSSITNFKKGAEQLKRLVRGEGYTDEHLIEHGEVFGTSHKGLNCAVIGGPKNRDGIVELYQRYPDFVNFKSTELDFGRLDPETRRFVQALEEMLLIAETMSPDTAIPVKYTRLTRDGVLYLVTTVDKFQIVVASKYSYFDTSVGVAPDAGEPQLPAGN